jgi:homoserine kinase type II
MVDGPAGRPELVKGGEILPPAAARVADELLRRYGLGQPLHVEPAPGGLLNQNLIATTAGGSFFLKGYRYVEPDPVAREHRLLAYAAECGLPAATPSYGPGQATFLRVGGRLWAVFPLITDRQIPRDDLTADHAAEMGRMLARIHLALHRFPPREAARYPLKAQWSSARALDEMAEYESAIRRLPQLDPFDQRALSSFAYRRTLLAAGVPPYTAFADLPVQLLHGDYHEGNLFFRPDGTISAVIDWELASVGPRALEIIRTLDVALCLSQDIATGAARTRAFLHAYAAEAPLTRQECLTMPELYWGYRVHSLWVYEEHYRKGSARTDQVAMEDVASLEWWLGHRREVAQALVAALDSAPQATTIFTARS